MNNWLDTETKAMLRKSPPDKLAPPSIKGFSLVLLSIYRYQHKRLIRAIQRIRSDTEEQAISRLKGELPLTLKNNLSEADALLGQFELICSDAISVFIADAVVRYAENDYLSNLCRNLLLSDEFADTNVVVDSIPNSESGAEFIDQFLGSFDEASITVTVPYKKARIMTHWGSKIGAEIRLDANSSG